MSFFDSLRNNEMFIGADPRSELETIQASENESKNLLQEAERRG